MRLLSLYMQAQGLGYSTVLANRAGGQSTVQDLIKTSPQGATAFPVKRKIILNLLCSISLNWIIQGCACAPISSTLAINLRPLPSPPPSGEGAVWLGALTPKWCASAPYGKVHRAQFGRGICDRGLSRKRGERSERGVAESTSLRVFHVKL